MEKVEVGLRIIVSVNVDDAHPGYCRRLREGILRGTHRANGSGQASLQDFPAGQFVMAAAFDSQLHGGPSKCLLLRIFAVPCLRQDHTAALLWRQVLGNGEGIGLLNQLDRSSSRRFSCCSISFTTIGYFPEG